MTRIFTDTSYWFSLAVRADGNHARTLALTLELQANGALLYLSELIVAETHRLILHKLGIQAGRKFLERLILQVEKGFVHVLPVTWEIVVQAEDILTKYADQDLTLADATSGVLIRRHGLDAIASYDRHFEMMGLKRVP